MHSFQLAAAAPTPASFGDASLDFLDHQASTPDMNFFDLLPSYYQDGGLGLTPTSQSNCASTQAFHGTLPMAQDSIGAYHDLSFLDPAIAMTAHGDAHDAFGATPDLSVGSHTPFNSEASFSPPPHHHPRGAAAHASSDEYAPATEPLRALPSVSCPCLSSLYMALESLSNLPRNISAAMRIARHAAKVAHSVISCKVCACDMLDVAKPAPMQAFQNMMLLATLVPSACNAYTAIVEMIDAETQAALRQGRAMHFSLREVGAVWNHRGADGGPWLPAEILEFDNTDLGPHEWRRILLAIIRLDVYGNQQKRPSRLVGPPGMMSLSDVVALLDERSSKRHDLVDAAAAAGTLPEHKHYMMTPRSCKPEDRNCVRVLEVARLALNSLVIG